MLDVGVHTAVADQSEQVERAAIVDRALDGPVQRRVRGQLPVRDRQVDTGQPLIDDEASADIGVPLPHGPFALPFIFGLSFPVYMPIPDPVPRPM